MGVSDTLRSELAATRGRQLRTLSPAEMQSRATDLIETTVAEAGADGVVVNLSGGIDSSTTAALAVDALGAERVGGLSMPTHASADANMQDAQAVATELGIDQTTIDIQPLLDLFEETVAPALSVESTTDAIGNVAARLRMALAYYWANTTDCLVIGTSNRSERLLGYFTKYGDGGTDLLPIGDLYKTEVRALARTVDVPSGIIEKPPTAGLWRGQTDEGELGAPYGLLDPVLQQLVEHDRDVPSVAELLELEPATVRRYADLVADTAHKRVLPPRVARASIIEDGRAGTVASPGSPSFATTEDALGGLRETLTTFLREYVDDAGADGVVVNLSGGLDSSVTATLAVDALGPDRVSGLLLPCGKATEHHSFDAETLAADLGIEYWRVPLTPVVRRVEECLPSRLTANAGRRASGNLLARLRMLCAYYVANTSSRLVLGTTNRTEWLLGFFTKYGDGGVDLQPLTGLYKTELRALARALDLPEAIIEKPPTAGEHAGQTDEADLGMPYGTLDQLLWSLVDADAGIATTARDLELARETVKMYAEWHCTTQHKRALPPTPSHQPAHNSPQYFHELELNLE